MAINYAWEKLYSAVHGAMMSTDPLPRRLEDGYASFPYARPRGSSTARP
jgi:hypothetical protein